MLEIIVLISGIGGMIFELVGSRILAPYYGTSIIVWTSLIGVILGSLSAGYYLGGILADKEITFRKLSSTIFLSGISIGIVAILKENLISVIFHTINNISLGVIISSLVLFTPPSLLLGMILPFAVKLKMKRLRKSGSIAGSLYAISTIGSIIGTFAAGFLLIPFFGSTKILFIIATSLILTSFIAYPVGISKKKLVTPILLITCIYLYNISKLQSQQKGYIDEDTQYSRIFIYKDRDTYTQRPVLKLNTDVYNTQSAMFLDSDDDLAAEYTKYYRLAHYLNPYLRTSLMIGGGAYSVPKDYLKHSVSQTIDVVEIDPTMTALARRYFNLKEDSRLHIYHQDGRQFLKRNKKKYDAIFIDAFNSSFTIPYQLTTKEAIQEIFNSLNKEGIVIVNIISSLMGRNNEFLKLEYSTYKTVFPRVYLFLVTDPRDSNRTQNIMLVGLRSPGLHLMKNKEAELQQYLQHLWKGTVPKTSGILTDDYAPVEYYLLKNVPRRDLISYFENNNIFSLFHF